MKITRWTRNASQPQAQPNDAAPIPTSPLPWQPAKLPQRESHVPEEDSYVPSGAFAFAGNDSIDDMAELRAAMVMPAAGSAPAEADSGGHGSPQLPTEIDPAPERNGSAHASQPEYRAVNGPRIDDPMPVAAVTSAIPAERPVLSPTYDHRAAGYPSDTAAAPASMREAPAVRAPAPRPQAVPDVQRDASASSGAAPAVVTPPPSAPAAGAPRRSDPTAGERGWNVNTGIAVVQPRSASEVLGTLATKVSEGAVDQYQPIPLGFTPLDKTIGGGMRDGELLLIGGAQGTGKTTMAVQMARNIVLGGQASVLYICFEHDEEYLLNRIIAMESVLTQLPAKNGGVKLQDVRREILGTWLAQGGASADLSANPRLKPALERLSRYGANLFLLRGSQTTSTVENMRSLVERYKEISGERRLVVFVDYMQKVPVLPEPPTEVEKVTYIVQGLKDVALANHVPMISIVAADKEGLKAARLRNHHLRGSSAINYEADIILILNEKYNIVAKVNIEFNPYQAQRFRDWVILSVEKNRGGQNMVDLEFQKHFEFSCFDANGRSVQEKLIEERLYND